jgi:hypothetical protein
MLCRHLRRNTSGQNIDVADQVFNSSVAHDQIEERIYFHNKLSFASLTPLGEEKITPALGSNKEDQTDSSVPSYGDNFIFSTKSVVLGGTGIGRADASSLQLAFQKHKPPSLAPEGREDRIRSLDGSIPLSNAPTEDQQLGAIPSRGPHSDFETSAAPAVFQDDDILRPALLLFDSPRGQEFVLSKQEQPDILDEIILTFGQ